MSTDRYQQGKIYKLVNLTDDEIYIGSTCCPLAKRLYQHKTAAKVDVERHVYKYLNAIGWDNVQIILIEQSQYANKMELLKQERFYIDELKPKLNKSIPTRTNAEYALDNAELISQRKRKYRAANKETITERQRQYQEANKERISAYKKAWYTTNREARIAYRQAYTQQNMEQIQAKRTQTFTCGCGSTLILLGKKRHEQSKRHIKWLAEQPVVEPVAALVTDVTTQLATIEI